MDGDNIRVVAIDDSVTIQVAAAVAYGRCEEIGRDNICVVAVHDAVEIDVAGKDVAEVKVLVEEFDRVFEDREAVDDLVEEFRLGGVAGALDGKECVGEADRGGVGSESNV